MSRLLELLAQRPALIVSLPANQLDLAKAAVAGGTDALKVHIHVQHTASGVRFGSLAEERASLESIISLGLPTGIVVGAGEEMASPQEMGEIADLGFDFFDAFAHFMPAWMLKLSAPAKVAAVNSSYSPEQASALESLGFQMMELAVVPLEGYGQPLNARDLAHYHSLREAVSLPLIIPSERRLIPEDVPILVGRLGLDAIMIGAVVTGREPQGIEKATAAFKASLMFV